MKNKKIILGLSLLVLTGCGKVGVSSSSSFKDDNSSNNDTSLQSSLSEALTSNSSSSSSSERESLTIVIGGGAVNDDTALNLIVNAGKKDINNAKTSTNSIIAIGYDNGRKYYQSQNVSATTYNNNLTISHGTVEQYFYDNETNIYNDEFYEVREIIDYNYLKIKDYQNDVFVDESEKINLLSDDVTTFTSKYESAQAQVSCGLGYSALEDLYQVVYANNSDIMYSSQILDNGNLKMIFKAEAENSSSNQKYVATFTYIFESLASGFLKEYNSEQAYYSLDKYEQASDISTLEPTYYAKTEGISNKGILDSFTGELPVDISGAFVSKINVSASKTTIEVDEIIALKYEVLPLTALNRDVIFRSSNESVARVDSYGRVTGISPGTCEIKVINVDSEVEGTITITVIDKAKPDAGDDSKKGDLKSALNEAQYQTLSYTRWIGGDSVDSITGMCIDSESNINSEPLSKLSISDFYYDENLRKATYVGDYKNLIDVLPFYDNGNDALNNNYLINERSGVIYRDVILNLDIYLAGDNTINYLQFEMRNDSADYDKKTLDIATLTNENVDTLCSFHSGYKRSLYYISKGFVYPNEE